MDDSLIIRKQFHKFVLSRFHRNEFDLLYSRSGKAVSYKTAKKSDVFFGRKRPGDFCRGEDNNSKRVPVRLLSGRRGKRRDALGEKGE